MPIKKRKPRILFIHGGMTFKNRREYLDYLRTREISLEKKERWHRSYLDEKLSRQFEIIRPNMPLADDAKYEDWKINFERYLTFLRSGDILIGSSLGGIFLAKYLSENKLSKKLVIFELNPSSKTIKDSLFLKKELSISKTLKSLINAIEEASSKKQAITPLLKNSLLYITKGTIAPEDLP